MSLRSAFSLAVFLAALMAPDGSALAQENALDTLPMSSLEETFAEGSPIWMVAVKSSGASSSCGIGGPAISACRQRGLPVVNNLNDIGDERFDVIVLSHVLEHLADPSHTIEDLKAKLEPDSLLCVEVPNARSLRALLSYPACTAWLGFDERYRASPIHLSYFTAQTLLRLLERHGFTTIRVTTVGLGLDGLIVPRDKHETTEASSPTNRAPSVRGPLYQFAIDAFKRTFFRLRMGQNLLAIARLEGTR